MNLSVEATSAYILICTLAESGAPITIESTESFWNDSPEALTRALEELNLHRVIYEELDAKQKAAIPPQPFGSLGACR